MVTQTVTFEQPYGLGYNPPAEASAFDWPLARLIADEHLDKVTLPSQASLIGGMPAVFDQNGFGTCVSDALVEIKSFQEHLQTGKWLYSNWGTAQNHSNSVDEFYLGGTGDSTYENGWYVKGAMEYARTNGVPTADGHRYLIGSYYTLFDGNPLGLNIQKSIALLNRPVQFGFPWHSYWFGAANPENSYPNGILPSINPPAGVSDALLGHSMIIWRYVTHPTFGKLYCARQSWGLPWGVNGNIYLTEQHISTFYEAFVAIDR